MNEEWMKDLQDRFADYEKPAPEGLLADIQREMERRGLVPVDETGSPARHRRLLPLWLRGAVAAAVVAIVAGIGALLLVDDTDLEKPIAQEQEANTQTPSIYIEEQPEEQIKPMDAIAEVKVGEPKAKQPMTTRQVAQALPVGAVVEETEWDDQVFSVEADVTDQTDVELLADETVNAENDQVITGQSQRDDEAWEHVQEMPNRSQGYVTDNGKRPIVNGQQSIVNRKQSTRSGKHKKWEVGANVSGMQGLGSSNSLPFSYTHLSKNDMAFFNVWATPQNIMHDHGSGHNAYATVGLPDSGDYEGSHGEIPSADAGEGQQANPGYNNVAARPLDEYSSSTNAMFSNVSSNFVPTRAGNSNYSNSSTVVVNGWSYLMNSEAHHRQPVKVGVSVRYHLDDRWSVQAGVDYSYHSSDLFHQIANYQVQSKQKLHFVGVPVALTYSLWSPGRFNVYLSAGGEVEKVVKGTQSVMTVASNVADKEEQVDVSEKPWQLSVTGSAGVQFSVTKLFSIYAEPGVAYYFDNKSALPTIYQEKPFNFNLNMGLRVNINR